MSEIEIMRYRPRRKLTQLLRRYDLLQFVCGTASWVCAAAEVERPTVLWSATTLWADRAARVQRSSAIRKAISAVMVPAAESYERRGLREADAVFALSNYTRDSIKSIAPDVPTVVAPCGIDTALYSPSNSPSRSYILCVARLSDRRKNVRLLLKAYASLAAATHPCPDLYLVGDPPSESARSLISTMGIEGKVHLLGEKHGEELYDLYRNALCFVLSSDEEGLGIVLLEAMASGAPVVSTACGGPETAVVQGETGLLTPVGDADALCDAMKELVSNPSLCYSMGKAGRLRAEQQFSLEAASEVFLEQYDRLLS